MDKLQLYDRTNNVNKMNLSELKTIIYLNNNKYNNKLGKNILTILENKITTIIKKSVSEQDDDLYNINTDSDIVGQNTDSDTVDRNNGQSNSSDTIYISNSVDSDRDDSDRDDSDSVDPNSDDSEENYKKDISNMYSRTNKKNENQKFTQTSRKIFDRMISQAEIINKSYVDGKRTTEKINRPFVDDINTTKLGERKYVNTK